jgi:hypothetical protein
MLVTSSDSGRAGICHQYQLNEPRNETNAVHFRIAYIERNYKVRKISSIKGAGYIEITYLNHHRRRGPADGPW